MLDQGESKGREISSNMDFARANSCQSFLLFDRKTGRKDGGKGGWREGRMEEEEDGGRGGRREAVAVTEPRSREAPGTVLVDFVNKEREPDPGEIFARLQGAPSPHRFKTESV